MTKDSRDAKIEQQDLLIRCLTDDMVELKRELETTKQERDIALKEAILAKAKEELADVSFNEYQYDLMENNLKLKEINNQLYNFRNDTRVFIKEAHSIINKLNRKITKAIKSVSSNAEEPLSDNSLVELQTLITSLTNMLDNYSENTEKPFKREFIKGIDTRTFVRNEANEDFARSAIFAYAKKQGLLKQAIQKEFIEKALFYWFSRPFYENDLKKLTLEKAKLYMKPYNRAKVAFEYAARQSKMEEYDFKTAKIE